MVDAHSCKLKVVHLLGFLNVKTLLEEMVLWPQLKSIVKC